MANHHGRPNNTIYYKVDGERENVPEVDGEEREREENMGEVDGEKG